MPWTIVTAGRHWCYPCGVPSAIHSAPRLCGDLWVWLIILAELLTFGIFSVSYAFARSRDVAGFNAAQATLDLHSGAFNTVLLITGSANLRWLLAAMACGVGFNGVKLAEYAAKLNQGIDLTSNTFDTLYLMLTAFHFLHVVVAMLALGYLALRLQRGAYGSHDSHAMETGAAFWHMVDLLWIVLFPLVYVLR